MRKMRDYDNPTKIGLYHALRSEKDYNSLSLPFRTRIHANQNESRAHTRLLFRLITGNHGTLMPSQSARAN